VLNGAPELAHFLQTTRLIWVFNMKPPWLRFWRARRKSEAGRAPSQRTNRDLLILLLGARLLDLWPTGVADDLLHQGLAGRIVPSIDSVGVVGMASVTDNQLYKLLLCCLRRRSTTCLTL
jgi:hypothetical protein